MADSISPLPTRRINSDYSSAGQPTPAQIAQAAEQGFRALLNLRLPGEPELLADEREQAEAAGLAYAHAPVKNADPQTLPAALAALAALPKPVLIHCRGGGRATALALVATATQAGLGRDQFVEQVTAQGMALDHPQIQQFLREHYGDPVPPETV